MVAMGDTVTAAGRMREYVKRIGLGTAERSDARNFRGGMPLAR